MYKVSNIILKQGNGAAKSLNCLDYNTLLSFQRKTEIEHPGTLDWPVMVLAVLSKEQGGMNNLLADWAIEYFSNVNEEGKKTLEELRNEFEKQNTLKNLFDPDNTPLRRGNVYIWPHPIVKYSCSRDSGYHIWILHTDLDSSNLIESFMVSCCTTIITFSDDHKASLTRLMKKVHKNAKLYETDILSRPDLVKCIQSNLAASAATCLKLLGNLHLQRKRDFEMKTLTPRNILQYMKVISKRLGCQLIQTPIQDTTLHELTPTPIVHTTGLQCLSNSTTQNTETNWDTQGSIVTTSQTWTGYPVENTNQTARPDAAIDTTKIDHPSTAPLKYPSNPTRLQGDKYDYASSQSEIMKLQHDTDIKCNSQDCKQTHYGIYQEVYKWIKNYMTDKNLHDAYITFETNLGAKNYSSHIDSEVKSLFKILNTFNQELRNMFDNYVCFITETDDKQFQRLFTDASTRANETLKEFRQVHHILISELFNVATSKLISNYNENNLRLVAAETNLGITVTKSLQERYRTKMAFYLDKSNQNHKSEDIQIVHTRVTDYCIGIMERSLDFSGRSNQVLCKYITYLKKHLCKEFLKMKNAQHIGKLPARYGINKAVQHYRTEMSSLEHFGGKYKYEDLIGKHARTFKSVISTLEMEDQNEMQQRVEGYLIYLNEEHNYNMTTNFPDEYPPLCICISGEFLCIAFRNEQQNHPVLWGRKRAEVVPAYAAVTDRRKVYFGHQIGYIEPPQIIINQYQQIHMIIEESVNCSSNFSFLRLIFKELKHKAEQQFCAKFIRTIIVIPSSLSIEHLVSIRNAANEASFKGISILREGSSYAFGALRNPEENFGLRASNGFHVLVVATETCLGVKIEVFCRREGEAKIQMMATTYSEKPEIIARREKEYHGNLSEPTAGMSRQQIKRYYSDSTPNCSRRRQQFLHSLYNKVLVQLNGYFVTVKKVLGFIASSVEWQHAFKSLPLERNDLQLSNHTRNHFAMLGALHLSEQPMKIRTLVLDHTIFLHDPKNSNNQHDNRGILTANRGFRTSKAQFTQGSEERDISLDTDRTNIPVLDSSEMDVKRKFLFDICRQMKLILKVGEVQLGILIKKIVDESIERAESVASHLDTTESIINEEIGELKRICQKHKINIKIGQVS